MRHELADAEWTAIKPMLPDKPRGAPRVTDRRSLNGIQTLPAGRRRYDKLAPNYLAFVRLASIRLWPAPEYDPEKCEAVFRKDHAQSRI